jgi:hypothetical protein
VSGPPWVDELFEAFTRSLPESLGEEARSLAFTLGLAPSVAVPWSEVFSHEVTLAAPAMLTEAMPGVRGSVLQDAVLAHLLAVIEAFGTDRIEDGQVAPTPGLRALLASARRARDEAILRVAVRPDDPVLEYVNADRETGIAIALERLLLVRALPVSFPRYLAISLGKQRLGIPASIAAAHAAGWDAKRRRVLGRTLEAAYLGLQLHDDVIDWEDDLRAGGAWALSLANEAAPHAVDAGDRTAALDVRRHVYASGVLARMLRGSERFFRATRRRAAALGALRLASWAREREAHLRGLAEAEERTPGFANRAHALGPWAREVLS